MPPDRSAAHGSMMLLRGCNVIGETAVEGTEPGCAKNGARLPADPDLPGVLAGLKCP